MKRLITLLLIAAGLTGSVANAVEGVVCGGVEAGSELSEHCEHVVSADSPKLPAFDVDSGCSDSQSGPCVDCSACHSLATLPSVALIRAYRQGEPAALILTAHLPDVSPSGPIDPPIL